MSIGFAPANSGTPSNPPPAPVGTDPLVSFLTQTRVGSCEQFAGAFVVLTRSLGLPSRVVVGFTAGRYSGPGEVTIRGADAHAWPQVYLGPRAGWVSFEPTPQQPRGEVAPEGVVGPSGVNATTPTTSSGSQTTAPPPTPPLAVPTTAPNNGADHEWIRERPFADDQDIGLGVGTRCVDPDRRGHRARDCVRGAAHPPPPSLVPRWTHAGPAGAPVPGRGRPRVATCWGRAPFVATAGALLRGPAPTRHTPRQRRADYPVGGDDVALGR